MPDPRPLVLALALEAAPMGVVRLARPGWRRSAFVCLVVTDPHRDEAAGSRCLPPRVADTGSEVLFRR